MPQLRALAAREPYFHDGSAATLEAVIRFYEQRFQFSPPLSDKDRALPRLADCGEWHRR